MKTTQLLIIASLALAACSKKAEEPAPTAAAPKADVVSESRIEAEITQALAGTPPAPPPANDLQREAEDIFARYPGKSAVDLLNVPEVNQRLRNALTKLSQDKELQQRINSSVDLAAQIKGLEGAAKLDLDMSKYDQPRTTRMLQAVISEDPKQIVAFLVGEIGEAAPDLSYGGLDRAPNGVSIVPNPAKIPTPPRTDQPE